MGEGGCPGKGKVFKALLSFKKESKIKEN